MEFPDIDYAKLEERVLAAMYNKGPEPWQQDLLNQISNKDVPIEEKPIVVCGIDPAVKDVAKATMAIVGHSGHLFIIDDFDLSIDNNLDRRWMPLDIERGERTITGRLEAKIDEEMWEALRNMKEPVKAQEGDWKPDNRKQRRIDAAKERRKPRGQRKKLIMDIETYDPNRTKDWLR